MCGFVFFVFLQNEKHILMAKVKLVLDRRRQIGGAYPVRIYVYHRDQMYIPTGVNATPEEWDTVTSLLRPVNVSARAKNARLRDMLNKCETLLLRLTVSGELSKMTSKILRQQIDRELGVSKKVSVSLIDYLEKAKRGKAERTQKLFTWAQQRVNDYDPKVQVADIDRGWIESFRDDLIDKEYGLNTVAQAMAWVSRALSLAVADGVINSNPIQGVKKPRQETRKKSLSLESMRQLRDMTFTNPRMEYARDIFFLQFYLLGINIVDLISLHEIVDGRVEYQRHKTDTLYSVKVMPEAMKIIEKWRGNKALVANYWKSPGNTCSSISRYLDKMIPGLTTNYARHTWATFAAELEIPMETISHALGHKIGSPITAIYIAYNQKKVDDANRKVINYVNADLLEKGKKKAKKAKGKK